MEDEFTSLVREAIARWREHWRSYKGWEDEDEPASSLEEEFYRCRAHMLPKDKWDKFAAPDPATVASLAQEHFRKRLSTVKHKLRKRFGIEYCLSSGKAKAMDSLDVPQGLSRLLALQNNGAGQKEWEVFIAEEPELLGCLILLKEHKIWRWALSYTASLLRNAELAGEDSDRALCEIALLYKRLLFPVLQVAEDGERWRKTPKGPEEALASTTGWYASQISLTQNQRLRTILVTGTDTPFENLLRELPAAILTESDAELQRDSLEASAKDRVGRVVLRLENEGSEVAYLRSRGKLDDTPPDDATEQGADEHALSTFLLQEELYTIKDAAGLSQREHQVIEMLLLNDCKLQDVADELCVSKGTVKTIKSRAVSKLKRAARH